MYWKDNHLVATVKLLKAVTVNKRETEIKNCRTDGQSADLVYNPPKRNPAQLAELDLESWQLCRENIS